MPSTLRNKARRLGYLLPLLLGTALLAPLGHAQQLLTKFGCNMTRDEDGEKVIYGDTGEFRLNEHCAGSRRCTGRPTASNAASIPADDPQAEVQRDGDKLHVIPSCPALCGSRGNVTELSFDLKTGKCSYEQK